MKKERNIVPCVLVASLLFSIGCYSTRMVTTEELKAKVEPVDITVWTNNSLKYEYSKEHYRIQGDTLFGSGVQVGANTSAHDSIVASIALADITSIEAREFSRGKTNLLVIGGVVVVTAGVFGIFFGEIARRFK